MVLGQLDSTFFYGNKKCFGLLGPGKSQVTTGGILPNKRSQLARYCLVWGIHPVYGPATVGQVMVKAYFTGCGLVHRLSVFFSFMFMYEMQVPS